MLRLAIFDVRLDCKRNQLSAGGEADGLLFVRSDIDRAVDDAGVAVNIYSSHLTAGKILARVDG